MTQSFNKNLAQYDPPLLGIVVLSAGAAPAVDALLAGRQQRTGSWIDEFSPCLQLLDDVICITGLTVVSRSPWITSVGTVTAESRVSRTSRHAVSIAATDGPDRIAASACTGEIAAPNITPEWMAQADIDGPRDVDCRGHGPQVAWLPRPDQVIPLHLISVVHGTLIAPLIAHA
jgi:hypothetical protein